MTCQTTVWRKSDMKHLFFSLMQRKQECKLLCPAEAKTEGKVWSLCNSSESHSSASGERAMEDPQLLTETHCHPWPEAKSDWKQARMHHPWFFIWSSISAPRTHFTLLVLLACSFHYHSPCILRDAANSPSDHHLHDLSGLPRPLFCFPMSAIYSMSQ